MSPEKALPFDEGYDAALAGRSQSENPYSQSDWQHKEWDDGFEHVLAALYSE